MTGTDKPLVNIFGERIQYENAPKRPAVRFSKVVFDKLCSHIADGMNTVKACEQPGMPTIKTVYDWLNLSDDAKAGEPMYGLSVKLARAHDIRMELKEHSLEVIAASPRIGEIEEIEYETVPAFLEDAKGNPIVDPQTGQFQRDPEHPSGWKEVVKSRKVKKVDMVERSRLHAQTVEWIMARRSRKYASESAVRARMEAKEKDGKATLQIEIINTPDV